MNTNNFIFKSLIYFSSVFAFMSCTSTEDETVEGNMPNHQSLMLNQEQKELAAISTGRLERRLLAPTISVTGEIETPPQALASVSTPMGGYIQSSRWNVGDFIKKGQILTTLSSPEYIILQQQYLKIKSELQFAERNYERQRMLGEQNATAKKTVQQSEAEFNSLKSQLAGFKAQLQLAGVNLKSLVDGEIQPAINLRAPMSGTIAQINHHTGQFAEPREVIFELVDQARIHLDLKVFEQDIPKIQKGQQVVFQPSGMSNSFHGEIFLISPTRRNDDRTFTVHAHVTTPGNLLKPGMFVEADIFLSQDTVVAILESALVYNGGKTYVVLEQKDGYSLQSVETGIKYDGWIEIKNYRELEKMAVVTEGASRVFAALQRE